MYRLLRDSQKAAEDLEHASNILSPSRIITAIRIKSMLAMAWIDQSLYSRAYFLLLETHGLLDKALSLRKILDENSNEDPTLKDWEADLVDEISQANVLFLSNQLWVNDYHCALALFMQRNYQLSYDFLEKCQSSNRIDFCPDNVTLGVVYFGSGISLTKLKQYKKAIMMFEQSLNTGWGLEEKNQFLCFFACGKAFQVLQQHEKALEMFAKCLMLDANNPFVLFRRGWTYKALGKYDLAGHDFVQAKVQRSEDPNFAVDFRNIAHIEYIELDEDPDVVYHFPSLLPIP